MGGGKLRYGQFETWNISFWMFPGILINCFLSIFLTDDANEEGPEPIEETGE